VSLAQTNILVNGGFEATPYLSGWDVSGVYESRINDYRSAEGTNSVEPTWISQDVPTVPGHAYILKFATGNGTSISIHWGDLDVINVAPANPNVRSDSWVFTNLLVQATTNQTHLSLSASGSFKLDAVELGWAEEPPTITHPVPSRSTFSGGGVTFAVGAMGGPELRFQWYHDHLTLAAQTNRVLVLTNLTAADQGEYWVHVTNNFGTETSGKAMLIVNPLPKAPLLVSQPKSQFSISGYRVSFHTVAFGEEPLIYQWKFNSTDIPGATEARYIIPSVDSTNQGSYSVAVTNQLGSVSSVPAILEVTNAPFGGGAVLFSNYLPDSHDAPVFDVDGVTRLSGSNYVAQLYAGRTPYTLYPVGDPRAFRSNSLAGYFFSASRIIPDVPPGGEAYIQTRAWDLRRGQTFEECQARGGIFGKSKVSPVTIGEILAAPQPTYTHSFKMEAGLSPLATAKIELARQLPDGSPEWALIGDPGHRYVVEYRTPLNDWAPLVTLTNETGVVNFSDPTAQNSSLRFYRAQIHEP